MNAENTIRRLRNGDRGLVSMDDLLQLCDAYEALRASFAHLQDFKRLADERCEMLSAKVEGLERALLQCARQAEALKQDCGSDPESPQAIRNGHYMNISTTAHIALGTIRGPQP